MLDLEARSAARRRAFYGLPNSTFSLLAAATVLVAGMAVERHGRAALALVALGFAVVTLLDWCPVSAATSAAC